MPLDANKAAHIQAVIQKSFVGRQKTVIFVYQVSGSYTYTPIQVILRPQSAINPQIPALSGGKPQPAFDTLLVAPLSTNFSGVVLIADTTQATAVAVAAAQKYEIIEVFPVGILPGGTHFVAKLRRFR